MNFLVEQAEKPVPKKVIENGAISQLKRTPKTPRARRKRRERVHKFYG